MPAAVLILGCQSPSKNIQPAESPRPPEEFFTARVVYPPDPVVLDFEQFRHSLNQLARQLSVVYVLGPDALISPLDLACLVELQTHYYRYGVQVLLIDLRRASAWPELKNALAQNGGNFPAFYFGEDQVPLLKTFLQCPDLSGYHLFIIDSDRRLQAGWQGQLDCPALHRYVVDMLQRAGSPDG